MRITLHFDDTGEETADADSTGYTFSNGPAAVFVAEMTASLACAYGDQSIISGPGPDEMAADVAAIIVDERGP